MKNPPHENGDNSERSIFKCEEATSVRRGISLLRVRRDVSSAKSPRVAGDGDPCLLDAGPIGPDFFMLLLTAVFIWLYRPRLERRDPSSSLSGRSDCEGDETIAYR